MENIKRRRSLFWKWELVRWERDERWGLIKNEKRGVRMVERIYEMENWWFNNKYIERDMIKYHLEILPHFYHYLILGHHFGGLEAGQWYNSLLFPFFISTMSYLLGWEIRWWWWDGRWDNLHISPLSFLSQINHLFIS